MESNGCIKIEDDFILKSTFLGQIASFYYIKHQTVNDFAQKIKQSLSIVKLLEIISYAKEYEEMPVRHNEDNYNEALAKLCPYQPSEKNYGSPFLKTFLLFQSYFGRLPPPIKDYITDTKLAIDNCIRIIQALMDISADKSYLDTTLNLTNIIQMIVQGIWINESAFKNIPNFTEVIIKTLHEKENISYLCQLLSIHRKGKLLEILKKYEFELDVNLVI